MGSRSREVARRINALVWAITKLTEGSMRPRPLDLTKLIRTMAKGLIV